MSTPAESIRSRFNKYHPDVLDYLDHKRRGAEHGRTAAEQADHEDAVADQMAAETRARLAAEHADDLPISYFDRSDPYPVRSGYLLDDPINEGRF